MTPEVCIQLGYPEALAFLSQPKTNGVHSRCRQVRMTVRVTTLKGPDAGAYYVEALPSYYLDSGEPPARGHRPVGGAIADLWDEAAGRIDQNRTAFDIEGPGLLGRHPRWDDGAYATSYRAGVNASERLDRALGRSRAIEPPSRGLGLGL